jgi:chromate transporter
MVNASTMEKSAAGKQIGLYHLFLQFLKIGFQSIGGGLAMLAIVEHELVETKKWITHDDFIQSVTLGQSIPGVIICNVSGFIAYKLRGFWGLVFAVCGIVIPSFFIVTLFAMFYSALREIPAIASFFKGVGPAVVGSLAGLTFRIGKRTLDHWGFGFIALIACLFVVGLKIHPVYVILGGIVLGLLLSGYQNGSALKKEDGIVAPGFFLLFWIFFVVGLLTFGGGFGMIPVLQHEFVEIRHWMTMQEFKDAVAIGLVTPGPTAIMATFIGYRLDNLTGSLAATLGVFSPSILLVWLAANFYARFEKTIWAKWTLPVVNSTVIGLLAAATIGLGISSCNQPIPIVLALITFSITLWTKWSPIWAILACGFMGILIY